MPKPTWRTSFAEHQHQLTSHRHLRTACCTSGHTAMWMRRARSRLGSAWSLLAERRLDPTRPANRGYRRTSDFWVSTTDPDATPMWTAGKARLGYHDHYVVDGGKRRIILAALVTPADVMENQPMLDLLWRVRFRRKLHPRQATGDTTYGTVENIVAARGRRHPRLCPAPRLEPPHGRSIGQDDFTYDAGAGRVSLSGRVTHCARADQAHRGRDRLSGRRRDLQRLPAQGRVHRKQPRPDRPSLASTPTTWSGCAATTPPRPIRRRCASDRSGSSRSLPRPSSGMGCAASGGEGSRTSISRDC